MMRRESDNMVVKESRHSEGYPVKLTIALVVAFVVITGLHWMILILRIPLLHRLRYWAFLLREQSIQPRWIGVAALALLVAAAIAMSKARTSVKLGSMLLLGVVLEFSLGFSKGHGLDSIRDRIVHTGHAEFATVAARQEGMINVARNYDSLLTAGALGAYAPSKPPGTLLLYMLTEKLANLHSVGAGFEQRVESLRTFASITWPCFSFFVLIPLFLFARTSLDSERAAIAALFYLCIPSVTLIPVTTDQTFFPLLAVVPLALAWQASMRKNGWLAFLGGVALYLAVYCSFGLAVTAVVMAAPFVSLLVRGPAERRRQAMKLVGAIALGAILSDVAARLFLHYDILARYLHAYAYHTQWKNWDGTPGTIFAAGVTNMVEFVVWLGVPLGVLLGGAVCHAFQRLLTRTTLAPRSILALAFSAVLVLLFLFGRTKSETARLWIFLVPLICVIAAGFVPEKNGRGVRRAVFVLLVLAFEFGTTYLTLLHQDFF
jgi:hypothetical protein